MPVPRTTAATAGLRRLAATRAVRLTAVLSRRLGLGGGSVIGGRVGLAIDPGLLAAAGTGRRVALVSGTNGKTTTTRLLAAALGRAPAPAPGGGAAVATSSAGANMPAGLVSALLGAPGAPYAALEVDEGYLGEAVAALSPEVVVLLNLSRDQLDRVSEVRRIAGRWRELLASTDALVVANADDPLVVWAASAAARPRYVAAGALWRSDAYHCPACDARLRFEGVGEDGGGWSCSCGLRRPPAWLSLEGDTLLGPGGERVPLGLRLPGRFNQANAALAAAGAEAFGVRLADAVSAMREVTEVAGRFATFPFGPATLRLLLAKNPAGFDELLALVGEGDHPVVLAVNARDADGHDPSWLWDVPFERLAGRHVVASGERRLDLAVRLRHAGVDHEVAADALGAIARLVPRAATGGDGRTGSTPVEVIANYTAFQQLRRRLEKGAGASADTTAVRTGAPSLPRHHPRPPEAPRRVPAAPRSGRPSALRVVVVHPDLLGTYGDGGNGLVLANRARWRGLAAELLLAPSDRPLPEDGDLYCLGGGEDGPQSRSAEVLAGGALERALGRGATVLAVCAGFQILGAGFPGADGSRRLGLGLLDVDTVRSEERRAVGELLVAPPPAAGDGPGLTEALGDLEPLSGFENHAGRTLLGSRAAPLGRVLYGTGNDGRDDGAVQGRIVATYLHGPVLARNPQLGDALLGVALGKTLEPLDDEEEAALRSERLAAIGSPRRPRARVV